MPTPPMPAAVRVFVVAALLAVLGFAAAAWTAGAPAPVVLGALASLAAGVAYAAAVDMTTARTDAETTRRRWSR